MTSTLVIFGDSLVDAKNTFTLFSLVGQNPFEDDIYAGGGNTKASDGLVLGEQIAGELGVSIDEMQNISILSLQPAMEADVHNYAHAGARSGTEPTSTLPTTGDSIGIGFKEQVRIFLNRADYYIDKDDVDVLISCGGNDLRDALELKDEIEAVAITPTLKDDKQLSFKIAKPIAKNLKKSTRKIAELVDEIVITGAPPVTETPEARDWSLSFDKEIRNRALDIIDRARNKVHKKVNKYFADEANVFVVDGSEAWQKLENPSFVDTIHPDTKTSQALAEIIAPEASEALVTFGF